MRQNSLLNTILRLIILVSLWFNPYSVPLCIAWCVLTGFSIMSDLLAQHYPDGYCPFRNSYNPLMRSIPESQRLATLRISIFLDVLLTAWVIAHYWNAVAFFAKIF